MSLNCHFCRVPEEQWYYYSETGFQRNKGKYVISLSLPQALLLPSVINCQSKLVDGLQEKEGQKSCASGRALIILLPTWTFITDF